MIRVLTIEVQYSRFEQVSQTSFFGGTGMPKPKKSGVRRYNLVVLVVKKIPRSKSRIVQLMSVRKAPESLVIDDENGCWGWQNHGRNVGTSLPIVLLEDNVAVVGVYNRNSFKHLQKLAQTIQALAQNRIQTPRD
jgi:hypothetical protein